MDPAKFDPHAAVIQAFAYEPTLGIQLVSMGMEYTLPIADPVALQPFLKISGQLQSTLRISNHLDFVDEEAASQAQESRGIYVTTTFRPTLTVLTSVYNIWNATTPLVQNVSSIGYTLIFQRLPVTVAGNTNSFDLPSDAGNFVLCLFSVTWTDESDDTLVNSVTKTLIEAIEETAKTAGVF
ncbi:FAD binding domain-containing protein [Sclerotinia borealis F-4128]|uniref:FAD binding domain-containing protein n=1 Tax=Sclerotinia borealis (strain F-4128) TaxID=1432307 RepID=W9C2K7_SCLBF|nr:FAD binding domain-containing protein [Sclerotinia borealis F-4128]